MQTLNYSKSQGQLSIAQRRAIISLLHKKRKARNKYKKLESNFFVKQRLQNNDLNTRKTNGKSNW